MTAAPPSEADWEDQVLGEAAAATNSASAIFALLGVGVTATATLVGVVLKHRWDVAAEKRQHERDRAAKQEEYKREVEKLQLQVAEERRRSDRTERRILYARALNDLNGLITALNHWRRDSPDEKRREIYDSWSLLQSIGNEMSLLSTPPVRNAAVDVIRMLDDLRVACLEGRPIPPNWQVEVGDLYVTLTRNMRQELRD